MHGQQNVKILHNVHICVQNLQLLDPSYTRQIQLTQIHSISSAQISMLSSHLCSGLPIGLFSSRIHKFCYPPIFHKPATRTIYLSPFVPIISTTFSQEKQLKIFKLFIKEIFLFYFLSVCSC